MDIHTKPGEPKFPIIKLMVAHDTSTQIAQIRSIYDAQGRQFTSLGQVISAELRPSGQGCSVPLLAAHNKHRANSFQLGGLPAMSKRDDLPNLMWLAQNAANRDVAEAILRALEERKKTK